MDRQEAISNFKKLLKDALYQEWSLQGHAMKGSIDTEFETEDSPVSFTIDMLAPKYVGILNRGVPASRVPFSPGSGATKSMYIDALTRYAMKRMGVDQKKAKSIAFAIAHTQKKSGMPTPGSYKYSFTDKRTGFIEALLDRETEAIYDFASTIFDTSLETTIDNLVKEGKQWQSR